MNILLMPLLAFSLLVCSTAAALAGFKHTSLSAGDGSFALNALYFEANVGQADGRIHFIGRDRDAMFYLMPGEIVWRTGPGIEAARTEVRLSFPGSNGDGALRAEYPLPGKRHYYRGRDARIWHRDATLSARVRYESLYPGIDLLLYGRGRQLEYDFIIAPGKDPGVISLRFSGQGSLSVDPLGNLVVEAKGGRLVHRRPVAYQVVGGARRPVEVAYSLEDDRVAFKTGPYRGDLPLVIDPVVSYARYLGGADSDRVLAMAVDDSGGFYVAGRTRSLDFPASGGLANGGDAFVSRFDAAGNLVYTAILGSSDVTTAGDIAYGLRVDSGGNAHVVGVAEFNDFPVTPGAYDASYNGFPSDAFVATLDPTGTLLYSSFLGGDSSDEALGVEADDAGNLYITGLTRSGDFPVKSAYSGSYGGVRDAFVVKLRPQGNGAADLLYSSYFGGSGGEAGRAIALAGADRVYIAGETNSLTGIATAGAYQQAGDGFQDAFVAAFDTAAAGAASLLAGTYLGGMEGQDGALALGVSASGEVMVAGRTLSSGFPLTSNAPDEVFSGGGEAFVSILQPQLDDLVFSTFLGGQGDEEVRALARDARGRVYLGGWTDSDDFPATSRVGAEFPYRGGRDAFITRLDTDYSLLYSLYLGGSAEDAANALVPAGQNGLYAGGETSSADMTTVLPGAAGDQYLGGEDAFLARLVPAVNLRVSASDNSPVRQDDVLEFTLVVSNDGPDVADDVMLVSSALAAGLVYQSSSSSMCDYDQDTRIVTCSLGSLREEESIALGVSALFSADAAVDTIFTVSSAQSDGDLSDNEISIASEIDTSPPPTLVVGDPADTGSGGGGGALGGVLLALLVMRLLVGNSCLAERCDDARQYIECKRYFEGFRQ